MCEREWGPLVRTWPFHVIDDDELARRARRLELQPELVFERVEDVRCAGDVRGSTENPGPKSTNQRPRRALVGEEFEYEVEAGRVRDASPVDDRDAEDRANLRHACPGACQ